MANENIAQQAYIALMKAAKAKQKFDSPPSSVNYAMDLVNKRVTGNFVFSFQEQFDESTGVITLQIADSLETETPQTQTEEST